MFFRVIDLRGQDDQVLLKQEEGYPKVLGWYLRQLPRRDPGLSRSTESESEARSVERRKDLVVPGSSNEVASYTLPRYVLEVGCPKSQRFLNHSFLNCIFVGEHLVNMEMDISSR